MATCPDEVFRNPDEALSAAEKAIELDGENDYRYLETLAAAEANAGHFDDAVDTQTGAVAIALEDHRPGCHAPTGAFTATTPAYREVPPRSTRRGDRQSTEPPADAVGAR